MDANEMLHHLLLPKSVPHPAKKLSTTFLVPIAYNLATVALYFSDLEPIIIALSRDS
jgi:hypothetical protein